MLEEITSYLTPYETDWNSWCGNNGIDSSLFKPTAVGWKVADSDSLARAILELLPFSPQAHIADVDNRKIGSFYLSRELPMGLKVVKVLQRRAGSDDPLGLDHVDFTVSDIAAVEKMLKEKGIVYEWQSNQSHKWISTRTINNREAKFVDSTVLNIGSNELRKASHSILS